MSQQFLSWDCAHKSLAWSYVTIDTHIYAKLTIIADILTDFYKEYLGAEFVRDIGKLSRDQLNDYRVGVEAELAQAPRLRLACCAVQSSPV